MKSAKTPLMALVQKAFALAEKTNSVSANEVIGLEEEKYLSRRKFLENSGKLAILGGTVGLLNACAKDDVSVPDSAINTRMSAAKIDTNSKVVIVGAGIAGLHAAHIFNRRGFDNFEIYESSNRIGGRMYTAQNIMAPGLSTEIGGEFIDSGHKDMLSLAAEFGLSLLDTQNPSETTLIKDAYYFNGRHYSLQEIVNAFCEIKGALRRDINSLPNVIDYTTTDANVVRLDNLSISAYLTSIGATGVIKELLEVAYETEYGLAPTNQSCINMLFLISPKTEQCTSFEIFGISDERYKIAGGNQLITDRLASLYNSHITTGKTLQAIRETAGGRYKLTFSGMSDEVTADYVLLTLPFTRLRQVDINVSLSQVKRNSINQLGYGTNAKLMMGFSQRIWRNQGFVGSVFSDNGLQLAWDNSQLQGGTSGGITVFSGGPIGVAMGNGSVQSQVNNYLPKLNQVYPGITSKYNGNARRFHWPTYEHSLGSYAAYRVGQWTTIGGAEFETTGNIHFAGEHCSFDFQGYMNGGAETGRRAARAILKELKMA